MDYEDLARAAIRARDFEALAELCSAAKQAGASTPQLEIWSANLARERGDFAAAARAYRAALATAPENFPAWFNLGLSLEALAQLEPAAQAFARSLARPGGHRDSLFRLGACLRELGRDAAEQDLYAEAVTRGLLVHALQRPRHYCPGLRARPWWPAAEIPGLAGLARPELRSEILAALDSEQVGEWRSPALAAGRWDKLFFAQRGRLIPAMEELCPLTMAALRQVPGAAGLPEGNLCASILAPGTQLHPHCGPTNVRLRAHLGLEVPPECGLKVAGRERSWSVGEWLVFDDSFEHSAWNHSSRRRVVLIVDVWHPQLDTAQARREALRGAASGRRASP